MQRINDDIKNGRFQPVYLLYGEERYLRRQYRDKLRCALCPSDSQMNSHFYEGKNIQAGELIDLAETLPFFAEHRAIFVDDSGWFKAGGEQMADYLKDSCPTAVFVFTEAEVDKRSRLYKTVLSRGCAVEFAVQDERTLKRWVASVLGKSGKRISEDTVELFLDKTGTDMDNIHMELEKLICYCMDREVVTSRDVEEICVTQVSDRIFDMIGAVADRRQKRALELYYDLLTLKVSPTKILALLARHCNHLMQAKEMKSKGYDNKAVAASLGVPPFAVGKYLAQASKFKSPLLREAVEKCIEAEEAVKTGRMNDVMSVEILILTVFA